MPVTERDVKIYAIILLIALLGVLAFFIIRPVILSVFGGLLLAYIFFPVYKRIQKLVKYKNLAAALVSIIVLLIILLPLWLFAPLIIQQAFEFFQVLQKVDFIKFLTALFPNLSVQLQSQLNIGIDNSISKLSSLIVNALVGFIVNFAVVALHLFLVAFVFFFTLRDSDKLRDFVSGISPINKAKEKILIKQFKDITQSIVYGQVVIGLFQGVFAGIGLIVFGIPNALVLTLMATILGIIPVIGPGLIYIPITFYIASTGDPLVAVVYLAYNLIFVSTLDNFIRAHIVARKSQMSSVIILIGMIGGLFIFGFLGLILGPLILAYFITFLQAYKENNLTSFFTNS